MNLLIAGASGFIGQKLVAALRSEHQITVLGRDISTLERHFSEPIGLCTWDTLSELDAKSFDAVVNLCGYNIAASRWSDAIKQQLIDSRVNTSKDLIQWIKQYEAKPHFICANAVGIYGMQNNGDSQAFDEDTFINEAHPIDFLSEIGIRWQQALQSAITYGMKVTSTRFGVVLGKGEGMLKQLSPSFNWGLGSIIGDGKQIISWVHIEDVVAGLIFLLHHPEWTGPFNLTSPYPVSQAEFARTLAKTMHRPLLFSMPAVAIHLLFGEMGDCLLLKGQRVLPKRLLASGYTFRYPDLASALSQCFKEKA